MLATVLVVCPRIGFEALANAPDWATGLDLVRAARADVGHFEQKITPQVRLEVETELLRHGRTIPLINERD
jgi:hypothetical protein